MNRPNTIDLFIALKRQPLPKERLPLLFFQAFLEKWVGTRQTWVK